MIKKKMQQNKTKGITLIALIVTIIVLLILAGISIATLTGDNGVLKSTVSAKEKTEISNEKEILEVATVQAMGRDRAGIVTKIRLQTALDENTSKGTTNVEEDEEILLTTFVQSGRIYEVDKDGNIKYLGKEEELLSQVTIEASPQSNTTPELVQNIELTVKSIVSIPDENVTLVYAWSNSENTKPEESSYTKATLTGTSKVRKAQVSSNDTEEGNYYLWAKVIIGENEIEEEFGPYAIKDHTTLVATSSEWSSTSPFLGSTTIKRNQIESVTIAKTFGTHSLSDENCWDVSANKSGKYIAWYEDNDSDGYYEVTIAGNGGVVANSHSTYLFSYIGYNGDDTTVFYGLENLDTGLVTNMGHMFYYCENATSIDVSNFNTSNVTNMEKMFYYCINVTSIDITNLDTSNVINMSSMFELCSKLTSLDVTNFDTSNVTNMSYMFDSCSKLTSLDVSNFDTSNVTSMYQMFDSCSNLTNLDLSNFDTSKVTSMYKMFYSCSNLTSLDVSKFDTSKVTSMYQMFRACSNLTSLDVSNFDTSNITNMNYMFYKCSNVKNLDVSNFNTKNVTNMSDMFCGCRNLTSLDVSNFNTSNVTNMSYMFESCNNLTSLNVSNFDTSKVTSMDRMFYSCSNLTSLDVSKFNTSNVTSMSQMFYSCSNVASLNVSNFNTSKVTNMKYMFYFCKNLTSLDLSNFNTSNVTDMSYMFQSCFNLMNLDISNFDTTKVTSCSYMFTSVPSTIMIKTNEATATWIKEKFTSITDANLTIVS